jgi:hypothetical protein
LWRGPLDAFPAHRSRRSDRPEAYSLTALASKDFERSIDLSSLPSLALPWDVADRARDKFRTRRCDYLYVLDFGPLIAEGNPRIIRSNSVVLDAYLEKE